LAYLLVSPFVAVGSCCTLVLLQLVVDHWWWYGGVGHICVISCMDFMYVSTVSVVHTAGILPVLRRELHFYLRLLSVC